MAAKKSMWVLLGVFVISAWVLGPAIRAEAETMNYKFYTWVIKSESVPISDMEGHIVSFVLRGCFYVLKTGRLPLLTKLRQWIL